MILLGIPLLLVVTAIYYYNIAKKYGKNKFVFALLGFFLPLLLLLFRIVTFDLIITNNPGLYIQYCFLLVMGVYVLFILLLPQYLSIRWKKSKVDLDDDKILDA